MSGTIAVTGGTGVIGTHCCRRLLNEGWTVRGLCREHSDRTPHETSVSWIEGDLLEQPDVLADLVDGVDAVLHLAGIGLDAAPPRVVRRVNVEGTRAVLEACQDHAVDRLVFVSTAGTRGAAGTVPADESDMATPVGAYQQSKATAELLVDRYARTDGDAVTVHPTSVFGPGDTSFTEPLMAMATEWYWPVHLPGGINIVGLSDVIDGVLAALRAGQRGEHYILGGENISYGEAIRRIAEVVGGRPATHEVPASVIRAAGPVAAVAGRLTGRRIFPYSRSMARLATESLFYSDEKARSELEYTTRPLEDHVPAVADWLEGQSPAQAVSDGQPAPAQALTRR
ncbi:MAG: NAD-dependent epimerase/dehydratase family protein [Natrialbaceae archaeon]|nr:NAD-dependent epimerase/dehydratase family protein [Natrialbaceae archaeon]